MTYRTRTFYTPEQKTKMWNRWQKGDSLHAIGRLFERPHTSIAGILSATGGIRPPERKRSRFALTLTEREEISRGLVADLSLRNIAFQLGRAPSTISREVQRNGGVTAYRASDAEQAAWDRAHRPKPCKLVVNPRLRRQVVWKLRSEWSPEQIGAWLQEFYDGIDSSLQAQIDRDQMQQYFDLMGVQRHLKATGIFARLNHRDGKPGYMADVPRTLDYIVELESRYEELDFLVRWLKDRCVPGLSSPS